MTRVAGWTAAAALSVYAGLKVLWILGIDVGVVTRGSVSEREWVLDNLATLAIAGVGVLVALATVLPFGARAPLWLFALPMWVGAGLLAPFAVVIPAVAVLFAFGGREPPAKAADGSGLELAGWVFPLVYGSFVVGGVALVVALLGFARRRFAAPVSGRPELPLAWLALVLGLSVVGLRLAAGGDAMQRLIAVTDSAQALAAVLGLLALLHGGGRRALLATWLGAGGMVAKGFLSMPEVLAGGESTLAGWTAFVTCVVGSLVSLVALFTLAARAEMPDERPLQVR